MENEPLRLPGSRQAVRVPHLTVIMVMDLINCPDLHRLRLSSSCLVRSPHPWPPIGRRIEPKKTVEIPSEREQGCRFADRRRGGVRYLGRGRRPFSRGVLSLGSNQTFSDCIGLVYRALSRRKSEQDSSSSAILSGRHPPQCTDSLSLCARPLKSPFFSELVRGFGAFGHFDRDFFCSLPFFLSASSSASSSSLTARFSLPSTVGSVPAGQHSLLFLFPGPTPSNTTLPPPCRASAVHFLNSSQQIMTAKSGTGALYFRR